MSNDLWSEIVPLLADPNPSHLGTWVEAHDENVQVEYATHIYEALLGQAGQSHYVSSSSCVKVCGFVERCFHSQNVQLQKWACSHETVFKLFNFYIEGNESEQHGGMKLALDAIILLLNQNPDREAAESLKLGIVRDLISVVVGKSTKPVGKSALKCLDHLLVKQIVSLSQIEVGYRDLVNNETPHQHIDLWQSFFKEVAQWMRHSYVCAVAGHFLVSLYCCLRRHDADHKLKCSVELWQPWLLDLLTPEGHTLEYIRNYVFAPLFKADKEEALRFLNQMKDHSSSYQVGDVEVDQQALLRLAALDTGKKAGLVEESGHDGEVGTKRAASSISLQEDLLDAILRHPSCDVRTYAFSLLISSPSTTKPYSSTALVLLQRHLGAYLAESDAKFRVDISGMTRAMYSRVRGAISTTKRSLVKARAKAQKIQRDGASSTSVTAQSQLIVAELTACLEHHENFRRWYITFLYHELVPTAAYQRHVCSLRVLGDIVRMESGQSRPAISIDDQQDFLDLFDHKLMRALLDLLMDPFDDVRQFASTVLRLLVSNDQYRRFTLPGDDDAAQQIRGFLGRAEDLARRTGRADHSDGVARCNQLAFQLTSSAEVRLSHISRLVAEVDRKLSIAERDLGQAVLDASVHGDFAALRAIWETVSQQNVDEEEWSSMQIIQESVVAACERIWTIVRDVLCDDSPEGHLPQELEDTDGLDTKDVLSYSFRSTHESSKLLQELARTLRNQRKSGPIGSERSKSRYIIPSKELFARIGDLTFEQLSTLRHRGAFSTVSQTFAVCCQRSRDLEPSATDSPFLNLWFEETMKVIFTQASLTRRSAGIPALMTGILSAGANSPSLEEVLERLMEIAGREARLSATDGTKLPQVHAFNCLKDIFKKSFLRVHDSVTSKYLPRCLKLAADGLRSEIWAIRNCGLIFLRSLIDYLFGTHETKSMIEAGWDGKANRIAYHKHPELPVVLVDLLKSGHQLLTASSSTTMAAEAVFPALDIIRRAGPPDLLRDEIQLHVSKYLTSAVWHVRDMAARTLCSCLLDNSWLDALQVLLHDSLRESGTQGQNHTHGVLLTINLVIERLAEVDADRLAGGISNLSHLLKNSGIIKKLPTSPELAATYFDIVNRTWSFQVSRNQEFEAFDLLHSIEGQTALLRIQSSINSIYQARLEHDSTQSLTKILLHENIGTDTLIAALEILPTVWNVQACSDETLKGLCQLYLELCLKRTVPGVRSICLLNLSAVLTQACASRRYNIMPYQDLMLLWTTLPMGSINPDLANSVTKASGPIMAVLTRSHRGIQAQSLKNWGVLMADQGGDEQTFDTRLATAESLQVFFQNIDLAHISDDYLSAVLALYNTLNDDDDEVRDVGGAAASAILGQATFSIEAAEALLRWATRVFGTSSDFKAAVATRAVGHASSALDNLEWVPADQQLANSLQFDDSLFVIEEPNLFIDEVRETTRWLGVLKKIEWDESENPLLMLDAWVTSGLCRMQSLVEQEDGPLGWSSRPQVFAICMRVALCAVALEERNYASHGLREALEAVRSNVRKCNTHVSGYLCEALGI